MYVRRGIGRLSRRGFGQTGPNLANPYAGTFQDVNCPSWCFVLGNGVDNLFAACTPCYSVCPAGQIWDTTNDVCSANPVSSNSAPADEANPSSCPSGQTCSFFPGVPDIAVYGVAAIAAFSIAAMWVSHK